MFYAMCEVNGYDKLRENITKKKNWTILSMKEPKRKKKKKN